MNIVEVILKKTSNYLSWLKVTYQIAAAERWMKKLIMSELTTTQSCKTMALKRLLAMHRTEKNNIHTFKILLQIHVLVHANLSKKYQKNGLNTNTCHESFWLYVWTCINKTCHRGKYRKSVSSTVKFFIFVGSNFHGFQIWFAGS